MIMVRVDDLLLSLSKIAKGNFGNMFFLWDVVFGTTHISRQYPAWYGISYYRGDPWYSQLLWPLLKSNISGSKIAGGGPVIHEDVPHQSRITSNETLKAEVASQRFP